MKRYLLLLIGLPIVALPAACGGRERTLADEAERLYASPHRREILIVDKESRRSRRIGKTGGTTTYHVVLEVDGRRISRQVNRADWSDLNPPRKTVWTYDPVTGEGIAEIERAWRTTGMYLPYGLAFAVILILCRGAWQGLPGGAGEARVRPGGPPVPEGDQPRLKPPPRDINPAWEKWMAQKYPPLRLMLIPSVAGAAAIAVPFFIVGWTEAGAIMIVFAALQAWTILLATGRGKRRDRRLWTTGEAVRGVATMGKLRGNVRFYEGSFALGDRTWSFRQRLPIECVAACDEGGGRITLLVDPKNPKRVTVVPRDVA